jgi:hypothetical protein
MTCRYFSYSLSVFERRIFFVFKITGLHSVYSGNRWRRELKRLKKKRINWFIEKSRICKKKVRTQKVNDVAGIEQGKQSKKDYESNLYEERKNLASKFDRDMCKAIF